MRRWLFFKRNITIFVAYVLIFSGELHASAKDNRFKKYQLTVCAFFNNEAKYLQEWIEYHRLIGVEHFYLYNSGSTDNFNKILAPYIRKGLVTLIHWPILVPQSEEHADMWMLSTKLPAYENAAKVRAAKEAKWLAILEVDEFLLPITKDHLLDILERYQDYPGIILSNDCYEAFSVDPTRKFVIEACDLVAPPHENIQKCAEKIIFKPEAYQAFCWAPYQLMFKGGKKAVRASRYELRINRYLHKFKGSLYYDRRKAKMHIDNRMIPENELTQLLELGYEIEDQEKAIYRFISDLHERLGY